MLELALTFNRVMFEGTTAAVLYTECPAKAGKSLLEYTLKIRIIRDVFMYGWTATRKIGDMAAASRLINSAQGVIFPTYLTDVPDYNTGGNAEIILSWSSSVPTDKFWDGAFS